MVEQNVLFEYHSQNNMHTQDQLTKRHELPVLPYPKPHTPLRILPRTRRACLKCESISNKTYKESKVKISLNFIYLAYFFTSHFLGFNSFHDTNSFYNQTNTWRRSLHRPYLEYTRIGYFNQKQILANHQQTIWKSLNPTILIPFVPNGPFLYPLKTFPTTLRFSDVFRGQRKGALGTNGLIKTSE